MNLTHKTDFCNEKIQRLQFPNIVKVDCPFDETWFIFIVFATGKSAEEMLGLLESRLENSREMELENGAREQSLIFIKRLRQLLEVL